MTMNWGIHNIEITLLHLCKYLNRLLGVAQLWCPESTGSFCRASTGNCFGAQHLLFRQGKLSGSCILKWHCDNPEMKWLFYLKTPSSPKNSNQQSSWALELCAAKESNFSSSGSSLSSLLPVYFFFCVTELTPWPGTPIRCWWPEFSAALSS